MFDFYSQPLRVYKCQVSQLCQSPIPLLFLTMDVDPRNKGGYDEHKPTLLKLLFSVLD